MDPQLHQRLLAEVRAGGAAYTRNLAAAETAIYQGQFNVTKLLRAAGHAQRAMALNAARLLQPHIEATQMFETILAELDGDGEGGWVGGGATGDEEIRQYLERTEIVRSRLRALLRRATASLAEHPDVLERDVHIFLWGCYGCGNVVEGDRPQSCDLCGAPAIEFQFFGPYYNDTPEHLGRLLPAGIVGILAGTPAAVADAVSGVDEVVLEQRPTADEWSAKENIAHFIETDRLFLDWSSVIFSSPDPMPSYVFPMAPWKTHEGKGYEQMPVAELLAQLEQVRARVVQVFNDLSFDEWSRVGSRPGRITSILDMGRWLANHDLGHLVHIRRLAGKEPVDT